MAVRFDDIGNRLKAFRLGSGLSADEIASRLGISRTALYRFEKGELAKIETLEKLAELLGVSVPTLLGVGVEYIGSAVAYFERMRQIEESSEHIIVLAGPISYLLASDAFDRTLEDILRENVPDKAEGHKRALEQVDEVMTVLRQRKASYRKRQPGIVNLRARRPRFTRQDGQGALAPRDQGSRGGGFHARIGRPGTQLTPGNASSPAKPIEKNKKISACKKNGKNLDFGTMRIKVTLRELK